jgi:hypothetical protein
MFYVDSSTPPFQIMLQKNRKKISFVLSQLHCYNEYNHLKLLV